MSEPAKKKLLTALDRSFLASERRDVMMHVGGLLEFSPAKKGVTTADFMRKLRDELTTATRERHSVDAPWNQKLLYPELLASPLQAWVPDENFDIEYHVRRSALPSPGDERELGALVSRLHGTPIDFHRPPWEAHFIEGLSGGRMAVYFKAHHSLIDGYTGMRLLVRSLTGDPNEVDMPLFWDRKAIAGPKKKKDEAPPTLTALFDAARDAAGNAKDIGRALLSAASSLRGKDKGLTLPMQAPKSILNQKIGRSRRFATAQVPVEGAKRIAAAHGGTVNDVILAISGAALRRFLLELDALPAKPLVAMVPVNVRPKGDPGGDGNAVGAILASLATDVEDPAERLRVIIASTKRAKEQLRGMSKSAIIQYSALALAPLMLTFVPGAPGRLRPAFNVVISNVPGPDTPLYLRGFKLDEAYPLSIPFHGYGLNITVESYAGSLDFGFTGCRDTLPHLQRLAVYAAQAFEALEGTL